MATRLSAQEFLRNLTDSGVLPKEELDAALKAAAKPPADGDSLAEYLVAAGSLTPFQAAAVREREFEQLVIGADVLDQANMTSWIAGFRQYADVTPRVWGLHNYGDVTYGGTTGTDRLLAARGRHDGKRRGRGEAQGHARPGQVLDPGRQVQDGQAQAQRERAQGAQAQGQAEAEGAHDRQAPDREDGDLDAVADGQATEGEAAASLIAP